MTLNTAAMEGSDSMFTEGNTEYRYSIDAADHIERSSADDLHSCCLIFKSPNGLPVVLDIDFSDLGGETRARLTTVLLEGVEVDAYEEPEEIKGPAERLPPVSQSSRPLPGDPEHRSERD